MACSTNPIKVFLDTQAFQNLRPLVMYPYLRDSLWIELEKSGIIRVANPELADFTMTSEYEMKGLDDIRENTIVMDNSDGCHFGGRSKWIDDPRIVAWVKRYHAADDDVVHEGYPSCFFYKDLNADEPPVGEWRKRPARTDKIFTGLGYLYIDHMCFRHLRLAELQPWDIERDIDVFFAGTTSYQTRDKQTWKEKVVSGHRLKCIEAIAKLKGLRTVVVDSKALPFNEYVDHLFRSKIVISPWGYGESCYRDYEALFYGCDVVKPQTSYRMHSFPDIYSPTDNDWMSWVKPDWSNLNLVVDELVQGWHQRTDDRLAKKRRLIGSLSFEFQARQVVDIFRHAQVISSEYSHEANAA